MKEDKNLPEYSDKGMMIHLLFIFGVFLCMLGVALYIAIKWL